ncbi:MAG TPA: ATP-binding protein [Caulobacteraceae bacterium]|jgi:adenylate kinase
MPKVIYLTGAPAAGKSSTLRRLLEVRPDIAGWEYGARLTEYVRGRGESMASQDELRSRSAGVITPDDVDAIDQQLLAFVASRRASQHVVIDTHAVTKEAYGFRITPFSAADVQRLDPDEIWMLYVSAELTRRRIANDPAGRPQITLEEAQTHTALQGAVAASYGILVGKPVYLFDGTVTPEELVARLSEHLP